jgi:hypothetical protein
LDSYFRGNNELDRLENDLNIFSYIHSNFQVLVSTALKLTIRPLETHKEFWRYVYFETVFYSSDGERIVQKEIWIL